MAWLSLFAFAIRNGPGGSVSVWTSDAMAEASEVPRELGAGRANDREAAILGAVQYMMASPTVGAGWELLSKSSVGPERDAYSRAWDRHLRHLANVAYVDCTKERISRLLQVAIETMPVVEDLVISAGLAALCGQVCCFSPNHHVEELFLHNVKLMDGVLEVWRRIPTALSEQWWVERSQMMDCRLITISCMHMCVMLIGTIARASNAWVPKNTEAQWHELIQGAIDVTKINHSAQLSRHSKMPATILQAIRALSEFALVPSMQKLMLASDVAPALLWASANSYPTEGMSIAGYAAAATADLIGRNEEGLILTHEAVQGVLENWLMYFDP